MCSQEWRWRNQHISLVFEVKTFLHKHDKIFVTLSQTRLSCLDKDGENVLRWKEKLLNQESNIFMEHCITHLHMIPSFRAPVDAHIRDKNMLQASVEYLAQLCMRHQELPKSSLKADRCTLGIQPRDVNDCISESFITAQMFDVTAHACSHKRANISSSVYSNQSAAAQICWCNPNRPTVFTHLLLCQYTQTLCKG